MHISGDKHADAPAAKAADVKAADVKAEKTTAPYEGADRRVSGLADRRVAPAGSWPLVKFPAWRYHATLGSKTVASQIEADALGAGWQATPIVRTPAK